MAFDFLKQLLQSLSEIDRTLDLNVMVLMFFKFNIFKQFRSHVPAHFNVFEYSTAKVNPFFHNVEK